MAAFSAKPGTRSVPALTTDWWAIHYVITFRMTSKNLTKSF